MQAWELSIGWQEMRHGQYATLNGRKGVILEREDRRDSTKWGWYHPWFLRGRHRIDVGPLCVTVSADRHKDVVHVDGPYWLYFLDPGRRRWHYGIWWGHRLLFERSPGLGIPNTCSKRLNRIIFWLWDKFGKKYKPPFNEEAPIIHLLDEFVPHDELYDDPNSTTTFPFLLEEE